MNENNNDFIDLDKFLEEIKEQVKEGKGNLVQGGSGCGRAFNHVESITEVRKNRELRRIDYVSKAVGKRILNLCAENDYTVNHLSEISGITQSTVSDIVTGKSKNIGLITIKKLCEGLNITLEDFFTDPLFRKYTDY